MSDELNLRIARLMDERGLKPFPFAKSIGVKSSTMTSIYKGKVTFEKISIGNFLKIAHGLGMTAEQLYYGEDMSEDGMDRASSLAPDEREIVDGYRAADERQRERLLDDARREVEYANRDATEKRDA